MAHIPSSVLERQPTLPGLDMFNRGKVRDSYSLPDHPGKMLVLASDRCSVFDFVLPTLVPFKGAVLTALNHFWIQQVLGPICETDLVACGAGVDAYLPEGLRNNTELQKRATVVRIAETPDVEDIVRIILTGSGWTSYQKTGSVCGHKLPTGLTNGSLLPYPIYTPTTKAAVGHDEHITADSVAATYGHRRERLALQAAGAIASFAAKRGIMLADTKFEFGLLEGVLMLLDEKGTPDSSRYVERRAWEKAMAKGQFPSSLDKQFVREFCKKFGVDKMDPKAPTDIAFVDSLSIHENVVDMTTRIYRYIFWRLTGMRIEAYQRDIMNIAIPLPKPKIEIVLGSESDMPQAELGLSWLVNRADANVSVVSCHRNPAELRGLIGESLVTADIVIAGAGMAAALPGIVKSGLCSLGYSGIPVIGVAFRGNTDNDNLAATLSIENLPGQPVELDQNGKAYFGELGFQDACIAAVEGEFLPKTVEPKPAKIDLRKIS